MRKVNTKKMVANGSGVVYLLIMESDRDETYLDFIRQKSCLVCRRPPRSHAHHTRGLVRGSGGTALKPSDYLAIPLCAEHHHEIHQRGVFTFQKKYRLDLEVKIVNLQMEYALE